MSAVLVEDGPDKGAIWHFGEPVKEQRALEAGTAWADLSHYSVNFSIRRRSPEVVT